ncbi:LysR family transcriptional regulator [Rubellimicrobium roseum]|uniref:LysR family transcriptional regulator n=2 Tax=Rubellimicrobium roseum TaxID=687525 RepID=A0A5C4NEA6_9RHOB|nr:LysR family transcriptional regulator [Rubellimicrobium roseum]
MNFQSLDLNLLRVLEALLETGSTVRAGERVGLSQPAVSAALGRLRHALGDPLLVRQGQRLVPTDYARGLAGPLREALDRLRAVLAGPEDWDPGRAEMTFRISGSESQADLLMPRLAAELAGVAPGIQLQLLELGTPGFLDRLERDDADLAILPEMDLPPWAEGRRVFVSRLTMIARSGHPELAGLAAGAEVPLDLFCGLRHVLASPDGRMQGMGDAALARLGRARHVAMTLPNFSGVCRVVEASDLVALVPGHAARAGIGRGTLRAHVPPVELPPVPIAMVWHRRDAAAPAHRWMRGRIAEILALLDEGGPPL